MEPLNLTINASHSQYGHKMSVYVLKKSDKIELLKTKLGVFLYVVNIYYRGLCINYIQQYSLCTY